MNIRPHILGCAIALSAFSLGFGAYAEYTTLKAYFRSQRTDQAVMPPAAVDPNAFERVDEVVLSIPASLDEPAQPETEEPVDVGPTGDYYLANENQPAGFKDLSSLEIETYVYDVKPNEESWRPIVPRGFILAKDNYPLRSVAIGAIDIAFETETVNGIRYRFVGKRFSGLDNESADISGKLTKFKKGKKIAEMDAEFLMGGC